MTFRYLDKDGAISFWTNIKNYILSKIPTKTSELTNDSGFLTSHQSLSNYVTLNTSQTITGLKTITGGNQGKMIFKNPNFTVGSVPESATTVTRIYFGGGASYDSSTGVISNDISSEGISNLEIGCLNNNSSSSARASFVLRYEQNSTRPRLIRTWGDLCPYSSNTYYLGREDYVWKDAYINNIHGISDFANITTVTLNANTTLTHAVHGRRAILAMGAITLTIPAPEENSWFLIKAVNGNITLNLASSVTVTGITAGTFSDPIHLQPNEAILLCYYNSAIYNVTISTIRRSGVVGRTGTVPSENPKHWFKIAENYVTATYRDPFICLRVFESTTGNTIGTLCAHCRINNTVGVVDASNCYLQWQDAGSGIDLSKYALTTNETSGTGVTITLWCQLTGGYSSLKFEVVSECGQSDQLGNPEWVLVRRRQTDGNLAELSDTDFTKIVYSTLTTLKNDTTGKASNVTGTVAIANGGTGASTRLNAVKNLTNESVSTPTYFLTITNSWAKAGYTTISQAKTVLGITGDMGSHSDSEYVHKTGDESITGIKTFGNGTLIVDNTTGSNVHGEIKLNGTRPVYINADNSEDGLFANTSCGMSILLNDSSKSIHIGGITTGDNGRKIIKTAEKAPYLTLGTQEVITKVLVPENDTADSTFSITSTLNYASGASAKSFTVKFRQSDDGSSGVFPVSNNKTNLGLSGNRWKGVYATNYYYGSDNTEFSDKFVTTDTTQTISGAKTFSSTITGDLTGNASTATEFSTNKSVTLTGDVTGTASSKAGWSVATTLANSGVTAGTYGPSADVKGSNNATILVPEITVDAKGRVTSVTNRTYTSVNTDNDKKVYQYYKSDDNVYRLLFSNNAGNTATSNVGAVYSGLNNSFYVNPSTGALYATKLYSNGVEVLTSHQSLSNYVTLNTAQEITNTKTFKNANTVVKRTDIEAGNTLPSADKLARNIFQDKNGKELGSIYYYKNTSGDTGLCLRAGDWFSESEGVYSLNASGTNRRAELVLYTNSSGNCCIKPNGLFSATLKPLNSTILLGEYGNPFGTAYVNNVKFTNATLQVDVDITAAEEHSIGFFGKNNGPLSYITFQKRPSFKDRVAIRVQTSSSAYKSYDFDATCFYPESNNSVDIGSATNIFKNIYCNNYYKGTTAFGDIVTHNASEFLTQHPSITLSTNTTSTASPVHGGTFTCIDSVTQDANGHITLVNTKTVTLPSDSNTDTKAKQYVGSTNVERPILSRYNVNDSTGTANYVVYDTGVTNNPSTHTLTASGGFIGNLTGDVTGNCSGSSSSCTGNAVNVTGTVAIANGGTGATTRLTALKALTNENVGTSATYFYGMTNSWGKAGYISVANAKTVLGITGDIVSHNAGEFLTSHQSLSSCLKNSVTNNQIIESTAITRGTAPSSAQTFGIGFSDNNGKYIGNIYGQYTTDQSTYVGLYAYEGTTTSNGDNVSIRVGYDASGNAYTYAPTPATADNSTKIATTAFVKAQGYLTSHQSLANYVTTNTDQNISGIKSHSKHISILGDYIGNESSTNGRSCLYLKANRDTDGKSGLYVTKFRQNVAQGSMGSSSVVFLSHDILENETRTNAGFVESYSNWADDVPGSIAVYSSIATRSLGTSAKPWTNAYITNLNLNGNTFDPTSIDGIGITRLLAYEPASSADHSNPAGTTKSGSALYDVRMDLYNADGSSGIFDSSSSGTFGVMIDTNRTQSGTWKVLHYISVGVPTSGHHSFVIAMWVRIA